jgi:hypothetical protein
VYELKIDMSWARTHYVSHQACSWLSGQYSYQDTYHGGSGLANCGCPRSPRPKYDLFQVGGQTLQWWDDFMEETFLALRDRPCEATIQASAEKTVQTVKALNCQTCSVKVAEGMRDFSAFVRAESGGSTSFPSKLSPDAT